MQAARRRKASVTVGETSEGPKLIADQGSGRNPVGVGVQKAGSWASAIILDADSPSYGVLASQARIEPADEKGT